jgi:hypothetical protein
LDASASASNTARIVGHLSGFTFSPISTSFMAMLRLWRDADCADKTFDIIRARDLMIEFVVGEPAKQLRDQFS